jgi:hypothetical protein
MSETPRPLEIVESNDPLVLPRRVAMLHPDVRPAVRRRPERWVTAFPHLIVREVIVLQVVVIVLALAAIFFDAPLEGLANPLETPNPAKAPWYFLGLQELLHYFPPIVAGVVLPGLVALALVVIPYARVNLTADALWTGRGSRAALALSAAAALLTLLFGAFGCWPVAVPTVLVALAMLAARGGEKGGAPRRAMARVTLPEWIMTWFVLIATLLTTIGVFFRGPGWSWVWPWL